MPGQQVLFALLVRPALLNAPMRTLAAAAGVATATAADRVVRLREERLIAEAKWQRRWSEPRRILDQWLKGYETQMRSPEPCFEFMASQGLRDAFIFDEDFAGERFRLLPPAARRR